MDPELYGQTHVSEQRQPRSVHSSLLEEANHSSAYLVG